MTTHYGKPIVYGRHSIVTAWESGGVLFYNPRVYVRRDGKVITQYPFYQLRQAMDHAIRLSLKREQSVTS